MRSIRSASFVAVALLGTAPALAQYSSDPAAPMAIIATAGDDAQAKIAPAPALGQYISYFSGSGYDVYLDRRDSRGNAVWAAPVLIEDRAFSSTTDYGMTSDAAGNAYVVYNAADPNNSSGSLVKMTSVAPNGSIRWTTTLYTAAIGATSLGSGRAAVASDGFVWGAYSIGFDSAIGRVNAETGALATSLYLTESGAKQMCSGLQPTTDGGVILSTIRYTTTYSPKTLRARRINADGTYGWGGANGNAVFTTGSIQTGNFPDFIVDGQGGAYFAWYTTANPLNCWLQHLDSTGAATFGTDGTAVAIVTQGTVGGTNVVTLNRTNPSAVVAGDGRVYVFFRAYTSAVSGIVWYGIGAQAFDAAGNRLWGDGGTMVEDYVASATGVMYDRNIGAACRFGADAGCSYVDSAAAFAATAKACRMNADGTTAWKVPFASNAGQKYRFGSSQGSADIGIFAWQGGVATGASDVFAARVNGDGTVGNAGVVGDINGDGRVQGADLSALLGAWGACPGCPADLNGDGNVSGVDLSMLLGGWTG